MDKGVENDMELSNEDIDFTSIDEDLKKFQEDEVVRDALSKGVDLRQYSRQIDSDLRSLEISSIPDYIAGAPKVAQLFQQINDCDRVLGNMQEILQGFQTDLGGISDEIKHLQGESLSMNIRLKNRKTTENILHSYLENLVVPDALIVGICQGEVNEEYLSHLKQLDRKISFVSSQEASGETGFDLLAPCDTAAAQDVEPQLDKLRLKAVAKVRSFLLAKMEQLKKPKTNVQIMQQNGLLKYSYFFKFLSAHAPAVAEEVRASYVDSMSRIIYSLFKNYQTNLSKLELPGPNKEDTIAVEDAKLRVLMEKSEDQKTAQALSLAQREALLGEPDSSPIIVHVAQSEDKRYPFEAIFRSIQKHLMDSATSEYLFTLEFFGKRNKGVFNQIFMKTVSMCLEYLENHLHNCYDTVSLLLMIRTTLSHRLIMERRRVPGLDGYLDRVNLTLWPYFKKVFDMNLDSLRDVTKLGTATLHSHYISKRYALYASKVYALSTSLSTSEEGIPNNLTMLRKLYCGRIEELSETQTSDKGKIIFLINNYDAVLATFSEVTHASSPDDTKLFEDLLRQETANFVEKQLNEDYGDIIAFVKSKDANDTDKATDQVVEKLVKSFSTSWRTGLETANSQLMNYFPTFETARLIFQKAVAQLLLYYTRFQEIIKRDHPNIAGKLLPYQEIREEIRQCIRQF